MKKKYMMPDMLVADIALQQMIAASDPKSTLNNEEANPDGEVLSREINRRNVWDDEEEEGKEDF